MTSLRGVGVVSVCERLLSKREGRKCHELFKSRLSAENDGYEAVAKSTREVGSNKIDARSQNGP